MIYTIVIIKITIKIIKITIMIIMINSTVSIKDSQASPGQGRQTWNSKIWTKHLNSQFLPKMSRFTRLSVAKNRNPFRAKKWQIPPLGVGGGWIYQSTTSLWALKSNLWEDAAIPDVFQIVCDVVDHLLSWYGLYIFHHYVNMLSVCFRLLICVQKKYFVKSRTLHC